MKVAVNFEKDKGMSVKLDEKEISHYLSKLEITFNGDNKAPKIIAEFYAEMVEINVADRFI